MRVSRILIVFALVVTCSIRPPAAGADEIIDRVLAVVAGDLITLSDVRAATALGLVDPGAAQDPIRAVLSRLIDRALVINEVNRYAPPEPAPAAIVQRIDELALRLGSREALEETQARVGVDARRLQDIVREDLRIRAYLAQRFTLDTPERTAGAIAAWIDGLRRRADIADLYTNERQSR